MSLYRGTHVNPHFVIDGLGGELILDHGHALDAREGDDVGHPLLQSIPYLLKIDLLRTETHLHRLN